MWRRFVFLPVAVATIALGAITACVGGESGAGGKIGPAGGTFRTDDGRLTLEVPTDALSENVEISVSVLAREDWPEGLADAGAIGEVYDLQPGGLVFEKPVTVTHRVDADAAGIDLERGAPIVFLGSRDGSGDWGLLSDVAVSVDGDEIVVTARTIHFSEQAAFGGTVHVSIYPAPIRRNVGESWKSSLEVWVSPENLGRMSVSAVVPVVGESGVVGTETSPEYPYATIGNSAGESSYTLESFLAFTCMEAGSDHFGVNVSVTELPSDRNLSELFGGKFETTQIAMMTSTAECVGDEPEASSTQQTIGLATPDAYIDTLVIRFQDSSVNVFCGSAVLLDVSGGPITINADGGESEIGGGANLAQLPRPPGGNPLEWPVFVGTSDGDDGIYVDCPGNLGIGAPQDSVSSVLTPAAAAVGPEDTNVRLHFANETVTLACGATIFIDTGSGPISIQNGDASGMIGDGGATVLGDPVGGRSQGQAVRVIPTTNLTAIMSLPCPSDPEIDAESSLMRGN